MCLRGTSSGRWQPDSVLAAHRPYLGVLEVILLVSAAAGDVRRAQHRPPRAVARRDSAVVERAGREYRVEFHADLLAMNESGEEGDVIESKVAGLRTFVDAGFRTFAVVDNAARRDRRPGRGRQIRRVLFLQAQTFSGHGGCPPRARCAGRSVRPHRARHRGRPPAPRAARVARRQRRSEPAPVPRLPSPLGRMRRAARPPRAARAPPRLVRADPVVTQREGARAR